MEIMVWFCRELRVWGWGNLNVTGPEGRLREREGWVVVSVRWGMVIFGGIDGGSGLSIEGDGDGQEGQRRWKGGQLVDQYDMWKESEDAGR